MSRKPAGEEVTLSGPIVDIIRFKASVEKAGVLKIRDAEKRIRNVVGVVDSLQVGDVVAVTGIERSHPTHGLQIRATTIRSTFPTEKELFIQWMIIHLRLGRQEANSIVNEYFKQYDTMVKSNIPVGLYVTSFDEEGMLRLFWQLLEPDGACRDLIQMIFIDLNMRPEYITLADFVEKKVITDQLMDLGLTSKESFILFRERGPQVIDEIKEDPYVLYYYVEETPFEKVDKIYLDRPDTLKADDRRVRALCIHQVRVFVENGDTAVRYDDLIDLMEEAHTYLKARELLVNLHELVGELLTFYNTKEQGVLVQPKELATYEEGFATWLITGQHPEGPKKEKAPNDDDFDFDTDF